MPIALLFLAVLAGPPAKAIDLAGARAAAVFADRDGLTRDRAVVRVSRDAAIAAPLPDPTTHGARLEIAAGGAGTLDIALDAPRWRRTARGYRYGGNRGELVRSVHLLHGENGGALMIRTRWVPSASVPAQVEVQLTIGAQDYCARLEAPETSERGGVAFRGTASACRGRKHTCEIDPRASHLILQNLSVAIPFMPSGDMSFRCDAFEGEQTRTNCSCRIDFDPMLIVGVGDLCLTAGPGCGAGELDCAGEQGADVDVVSDHNIGVCTDNAHCRDLCAARCGELGVAYEPLMSGCEAFCAGGEHDGQQCLFQEDCPGGFCAGRDSGQSGRSCHCVCGGSGLGTAAGEPSLTCNASLGLTIEDVEIQGDGICGNGPPALTIAPLCQPMTTAAATVSGRNVIDVPGANIDPVTDTGAAPSCSEITLGLGLAGGYATFGRTTGDALLDWSLRCRE